MENSTYRMVANSDENIPANLAHKQSGSIMQQSKRAPLGDISNNVIGKTQKVDSKELGKKQPRVEPAEQTVIPNDEAVPVSMDLDDIDLELDDIDITNIDDPQWVSEYAADIYDHYFQIETVHLAAPDYMSNQPDIRPDMRRILVDWLVEVHNMFNLKQETLFLAINVMDRYVSVKPLKRTQLQLVGSTALFVASKYEEMLAPEVEDFVYVSDKAFNRDDVLMCESEFCTTLQFQFTVPTPYHFAQRFAQVAEFDERNSFFASYLMELTLIEYSFLVYPPSVIAASAIYLTTYFDGQPWGDHLIQHTRYVYADIRLCVKEMYALLASDKTSNSVVKKYSAKSRKRVAQIGLEVVQAQIRQHQEQQQSQ